MHADEREAALAFLDHQKVRREEGGGPPRRIKRSGHLTGPSSHCSVSRTTSRMLSGDGAERLELRPTESGANVWLLEPYDDVVFDRTASRDGAVCVSPTQLAVDLLTGPGRDPSEGEELLAWMKGNERAWRTR